MNELNSIHLPALVGSQELAPDWESRRETLRARIRAFLGVRPAEMPAPGTRIVDRVKFAGYRRLTVRFKVEADEEISAYVYLPDTAHKVPGVLAYHQTADDGKEEVAGLTDAPSQFAYAPLLAQNGFAVISFDDVAAGDRVRPGDKAYFTNSFYGRHPDWSAFDKAVWDGKQALTVLASFEQVDGNRLAAAGHSQGGLYAWMLAADDERVKAAVANCGFSTLQGDVEPERWARSTWYVGMPKMVDPIARRDFPFDFHEWAALIAPRGLLLMGAKNDISLPNWQGFEAAATELRKVYKLNRAQAQFKAVLTDGIHEFNAEAQKTMVDFLREHV